jgi:hypothetical protein
MGLNGEREVAVSRSWVDGTQRKGGRKIKVKKE